MSRTNIQFTFPNSKADEFIKWLDTHPEFVDVLIIRI